MTVRHPRLRRGVLVGGALVALVGVVAVIWPMDGARSPRLVYLPEALIVGFVFGWGLGWRGLASALTPYWGSAILYALVGFAAGALPKRARTAAVLAVAMVSLLAAGSIAFELAVPRHRPWEQFLPGDCTVVSVRDVPVTECGMMYEGAVWFVAARSHRETAAVLDDIRGKVAAASGFLPDQVAMKKATDADLRMRAALPAWARAGLAKHVGADAHVLAGGTGTRKVCCFCWSLNDGGCVIEMFEETSL